MMSLRMFWAGIVFLAIAVVAALFGLGVVSDDSLAGKLFSVFFLLAAAASFGWVWLNRSRQVA
jgi:hypothetical protein